LQKNKIFSGKEFFALLLNENLYIMKKIAFLLMEKFEN